MDRLKELFDRQVVFQSMLGHDVSSPTPVDVMRSLTGIVSELGEVLSEYQEWKSWKRNKKPIDRDKLKEEVVDLWHFVINLTLYLGFDDEDIYDEFVRKNEVNKLRQETGY